MKFFLLDEPSNYEYASFSHIGTWKKTREFCNVCTTPVSQLVEPLQIEWEPGSEKLGDFSWCGYTIVVKNSVKLLLARKKFECDYGKVIVDENSLVKKKDKIIPFPYTGPDLYWLIPTKKLNLDIKKSNLEVKVDCPSCGYKDYKFKTENLFISASSEWCGEKIFRINQFGMSTATFITEEGIEELLPEKLTNLDYKEVGSIE